MADRRLSKLDLDTDRLAALGKKQVLKRRFGFWSLLAFAVCELITWETVLALFQQGLYNGGPGGLFWGYIIAWLSTLSVYTCIAELASIAPIASGQYYWVYMLAPPDYKQVASYITGWLTSLAWIATVATESLFAGTIIQGLMVINDASYDAKRWQGTLLTWAVIAFNVLINVVVPGILPRFELLWMFIHIGAYIGVMVALLTQTKTLNDAHEVFFTSLNEGGWSTQGLSYCVGFLGNVATFVGADASVHMAEEVDNAAMNIPRAITAAMIVNGSIGFGMMITLLYCVDLKNIDSVLESKTGFPFIQIFYDSFGNSGHKAVAAGAFVLVLTWACALGITTTASRMTWSFARDKGTPLSSILSKVSRRTHVPYIAVFAVTFIAALLVLIYIGSYTAFNSVVSLTITGFYGSYLLPCALLLYHRVKGHILPYGTLPADDEPRGGVFANTKVFSTDKETAAAATGATPESPDDIAAPALAGKEKKNDALDLATAGASVEIAQARLVWGPWKIPGMIGAINNAYACVYMVFVIFWSVWPPDAHVTSMTMNYSIVVTGGVMILSGAWYFIRGRRVYKGPLVDKDIEHVARRMGSVVSTV